MFTQAFGSEAQARRGHPEYSRGTTYVELIVVLSIFALMTSVVLFNYGEFQAKVDIKNLTSDIALQIVEAQKSALSGELLSPVSAFASKPSYGVYFSPSPSTSFIYFADLNNDKIYNDNSLSTINLQNGNFIEKIEKCSGSPTVCVSIENPFLLSITFTRPDSRAFFYSGSSELTGFSYIKISVKSPKGPSSGIKVYPSGRIQVN